MVAELFSNSQSRQCHRSTCSRRLVHLSVNEGCLTLFQFFRVNQREVPLALLHCFFKFLAITNNTRLEHISYQVVTLTSTLAYTRKYRVTVVAFGDIVNQLHDEHGFTYTSTTKQANLTTFHIRFEQVDNLNTGSQHLFVCRKVFEFRCLAVNRIWAFHIQLFHTINGLTDDVHHSALNLFTGRHSNRSSCLHHFQSTL